MTNIRTYSIGLPKKFLDTPQIRSEQRIRRHKIVSEELRRGRDPETNGQKSPDEASLSERTSGMARYRMA